MSSRDKLRVIWRLLETVMERQKTGLKIAAQSVLFTDFQRNSSLAVGKTASYIRDIAAAPL
jgi:hypothetical protein